MTVAMGVVMMNIAQTDQVRLVERTTMLIIAIPVQVERTTMLIMNQQHLVEHITMLIMNQLLQLLQAPPLIPVLVRE
jgi:hypothetical protein